MERTPDRWRELEARVAAHFAAHGYATERNTVREGRSGGRHEVDVLATKSDDLTTYRVAVECKAWSDPVATDAVAKLDHVVRDLGLSKGILVSLSGFHQGARLAADHHGIDLWGPDEVAHHLGADVHNPRPTSSPAGLALEPRVDGATGARLIRQAAAGGVLGLGRERVAWSGLAWMPACEVRIALTRTEGRLLPRTAVNRQWNLYEAITGALVATSTRANPFVEVDLDQGEVVQPLIPPSRFGVRLARAFERFGELTSRAALDRHAAQLATLGIPLPLDAIDVEDCRAVLLPFHAGLLQRRAQERLVAVDAVSRRLVPAVTAATNANLRHVVDCLRSPVARGGQR